MIELNDLLAKANKQVVQELRDHLARALREFITLRSGHVPTVDVFFGVHNFHKGVILTIEEETESQGARQLLRVMAVDALARALLEDWDSSVEDNGREDS